MLSRRWWREPIAQSENVKSSSLSCGSSEYRQSKMGASRFRILRCNRHNCGHVCPRTRMRSMTFLSRIMVPSMIKVLSVGVLGRFIHPTLGKYCQKLPSPKVSRDVKFSSQISLYNSTLCGWSKAKTRNLKCVRKC